MEEQEERIAKGRRRLWGVAYIQYFDCCDGFVSVYIWHVLKLYTLVYTVYGMHSVLCAVFLCQLYLNKVVKIDVFRNLY